MEKKYWEDKEYAYFSGVCFERILVNVLFIHRIS